MLIGESKESNEDVQDGEGHEPDVSRVPGRFGARSRGDNDLGQILNALPQKGSFGMAFVLNHVLGKHNVAGGLNELDREGSECWRRFVGQFVSVPDKALRKDPMTERSGDQVTKPQGNQL